MKSLLLTRGLRITVVLLTGVVTSAHYGSQDIVYEGAAGRYRISVLIRPPQVLPAQARILVQVTGSNRASVTVQPVQWGLQPRNAPAPEPLLREPGPTQAFSGDVWLMTMGSYRFRLTVRGELGEGTAIIPVPAILARAPASQTGSTILLGALGIALVSGTLMVVMAISRDGPRRPGRPTGASDRTRARHTGRSGALVGLAVSGVIGIWWFQVSAGFERRVFQPYGWSVSLAPNTTNQELRIRLEDPRWNWRAAQPIPDHGYPIHLFLIRSPDREVFAHLHPVALDSVTYQVALPPLPPGTYRVFGDLVHADGIPETLVDTLVLGDRATTPWIPTSQDDSWWTSGDHPVGAPQWAEPRGRISAGSTQFLSFSLKDSAGSSVPHEPLMGMDGHAVVVREDLSVFVHLHPMGTVSMAAMEELALKDGAGQPHEMPQPRATLEPVRFPWVFPSAGRYRVWGQTRSAGVIVTGVADFAAEEAP